MLVECMTDNRNRTVGEVRHAFDKRGGNLGTDGSVAYLFNRIGQISYGPGIDEDALMEVCLLYTSPSPRDKRQSRMPSSA